MGGGVCEEGSFVEEEEEDEVVVVVEVEVEARREVFGLGFALEMEVRVRERVRATAMESGSFRLGGDLGRWRDSSLAAMSSEDGNMGV